MLYKSLRQDAAKMFPEYYKDVPVRSHLRFRPLSIQSEAAGPLVGLVLKPSEERRFAEEGNRQSDEGIDKEPILDDNFGSSQSSYCTG